MKGFGGHKFFVTREDDSIFNIADVFTFVIAFFVIWLLIMGFKATSRITNDASKVASISLEKIKTAVPPITTNTSSLETPKEEKQEVANATSIKSIVPELSDRALEVISKTGETASKLLTKEGAKDTISSINSYLNEAIFSVSDTIEGSEREDSLPKKEASDKDELSSF